LSPMLSQATTRSVKVIPFRNHVITNPLKAMSE
jgi:hypothetical protein